MTRYCSNQHSDANSLIRSTSAVFPSKTDDRESCVSEDEKPEVRIYAINTERDRGPNWVVRICFFQHSRIPASPGRENVNKPIAVAPSVRIVDTGLNDRHSVVLSGMGQNRLRHRFAVPGVLIIKGH